LATHQDRAVSPLPVHRFFEQARDLFSFKLYTRSAKSQVPITVSDINRPQLALAGFTGNFLKERIQILGETEISYLKTLSEREHNDAIDRLFLFPLVCIIISKDLPPPPYLLKSAEEKQVPILGTPQSTTPFIHVLGDFLNSYFAPKAERHGTLVDVYGVGLLFTGKHGIGKSEIALDLVERGHRLVADDTVVLVRPAEDVIVGTGKSHLRQYLEIRGVGIIDVREVFGIRAVRVQKRVEVVVNLQEWSDETDWDRTGLEEKLEPILDVQIPRLEIPIYPGKNITVISEVIALNHMLRVYGFSAPEALNRGLREIMNFDESDHRTRTYLRHDTE
jgi:HPr kinase/phosphorylase